MNACIRTYAQVGQHGTLTLAHGQMSASLEIPIIDDTSYEKDETFLCILSDPTGGATFPADTDGREDSEICTDHPTRGPGS